MKKRKQRKPRKQWVYVGPSSIPQEVKQSLKERLEHHALENWENCRAIRLRFRGPFAYVDALDKNPFIPSNATPEMEKAIRESWTYLFRLRYQGSLDKWEFAFYKYSDEYYQLCILPSGSFTGTPEECFDCAAKVYLL